jgi:hypothetical protein
MADTAYIDKNTRAGRGFVNSYFKSRITVFTLAALFPYQWTLALFGGPLYPRNSGIWPYAIIPFAIAAGYFYLHVRAAQCAQSKIDAERREANRAAELEKNKTPEQRATEAAARAEEAAQKRAEIRQQFVGLKIGQSTGMLCSRGHVGGVPQGQNVELAREDASKNIIIFGGTGGGKTSRSINPLLRQLMMQNAGALIFDIKTDFSREVQALCDMTGRTFQVVGDGGMTLNLFRGCTPELASSYLKSCFLSDGQGKGDSSFWVNGATEMSRHCLTLLRLLRPEQYSIAGLYDLLFDDNDRAQLLEDGAARVGEMSDRDQRFFVQSQRYIVNVWNEHDEKVMKGLKSTLDSVLGPFAHPDMIDAFSAGSEQGEADMTELVNDGAVFLVNLPMTKYGREGARFAYMIIKLRFMDMMRERRTKPEWNQDRPVAFVCDEYQSIIDPISDVDFWDKSRSTRTIGIVSMQGVASLVNALGNNKAVAEAILQNFRQRIIFRTEDEATLRHIRDVLGQVDVHVNSAGTSESESESYSRGGSPGSGSISTSYSASASENTSIQRQDVFGSNDMRSLSADFCLYIGNVGDRAVDEVLSVKPLYIN